MRKGIFERRPYLIPLLIVSISLAFGLFVGLTGETETDGPDTVVRRILVGILAGFAFSVIVFSLCFCEYYTRYKNLKACEKERADERIKDQKHYRWQQRIGFPLSYKDLSPTAKEELGEEIVSHAQAVRDNPGDVRSFPGDPPDVLTTPGVFNRMHYFYWCIDICEIERFDTSDLYGEDGPERHFDGSLVVDVRDFLISRAQTHMTKCAQCSEKVVETLCKLGDLDEIRREFEVLKDAFLEPVNELMKKSGSYSMFLTKRIEEIEGGREQVNKFVAKIERCPELVKHLNDAMDWEDITQALFVANEIEMARLAEILYEAHQGEETYTEDE